MIKKYEVNGRNIVIKPTHSKFSRTANEIKNEILHDLSRIGITSDYIDIELPRNPLKRETPAEISWYVNEENFYYKCETQENYRDNLGVISKLVNMEVYSIKNGLKSFTQVMNQFRIGYNPDTPITKSPQEILEIPQGVNDLEYIKFKYKELSKKYHPDNPEGSAEKFKEINEAYKQLTND